MKDSTIYNEKFLEQIYELKQKIRSIPMTANDYDTLDDMVIKISFYFGEVLEKIKS